MKEIFTITMLGAFGANNSGDDALLWSAVNSIREEMPGTRFYVPAGDPDWYRDDLEDLGVTLLKKSPTARSDAPSFLDPTSLAGKAWRMRFGPGFWGSTTLYSILRSDAIVLVGGIFFDYRFSEPFFNHMAYLKTLIPAASRLGKRIMTFNTGMGPVTTPDGERALRRILSACDIISTREKEGALHVSEHLGRPMYHGADAAFNDRPVSEDDSKRLLSAAGVDLSRPLLGINLCSYLDKWTKTGGAISREDFTSAIAISIKTVSVKTGALPVIITTGRTDLEISLEVRDLIDPRIAVMSNETLDHHQIMGLCGQMDLVLGMRHHGVLFSVAMGTPAVGIEYAPKVANLLETVGTGGSVVRMESFSAETLTSALLRAWEERKSSEETIRERLPALKRRARFPAVLLRRLLRGESLHEEEWDG